MYEKVSMYHPDKIADRIAGAIVDLAYTKRARPKVAVEVLIGHDHAFIINETNTHIKNEEVVEVVRHIIGRKIRDVQYYEKKQDERLAANQKGKVRCGDNGIFKGVPYSAEEIELARLTKKMDDRFQSDGKYILDKKDNSFIICQSNATENQIRNTIKNATYNLTINPLGEWSGGINVDSGATNRKLGSDLGNAITGGGLHGKDLSKADVSITIMCSLLASEYKEEIEAKCAIGDESVSFIIPQHKPLKMAYTKVVECVYKYIKKIGGFEKLAEYGLVR